MTMETVGEQQLDPNPPQQQQLGSTCTGGDSGAVASVTPTGSTGSCAGDLISASDLSPSISRSTAAVAGNGDTMIDTNDYRVHQMHHHHEPTYQTLNGRMSPGVYNHVPSPTNNSYATLTPLQPLPPISTVSDKFGHGASPNVSGSFTLMQNNMGLDMNSYRYDKMIGNMGVNVGTTIGSHTPSPMSMMGSSNGYPQSQPLTSAYTPYSQNGLHSPKLETKMMSPNSSYDGYSRGLGSPTGSRLHSPNPMMPATLNGLHHSMPTSPVHPQGLGIMRDRPPSSTDSQNTKQELEEINTKELAQKISSELKRYSIPQAVFAQRVLCRSQGTLSDLLRNPKPWSKLKSGRETFRRMWKWLQEPEFQRMSALRLAGKSIQ